MTARKVLKSALSVDVLLVVLYLVLIRWDAVPATIRQWVDLDDEHNIPTWYSSVQLLLIGAVALWASADPRTSLDRDLRRFWRGTAALFAFLSLDETALIHEGLTVVLKEVGVRSPFPDGHGIWIFVYPLVLFVLIAVFRNGLGKFLREPKGRTVFFVGACVFVAGGVGMEIVSYFLDWLGLGASRIMTINVALEEGGELVGQSLMLYAVLVKADYDSEGRAFLWRRREDRPRGAGWAA